MFLICSEVYCPSSLGRYDTKWSTLRKKSAQKVVFRPALTQLAQLHQQVVAPLQIVFLFGVDQTVRDSLALTS